MTLDEYMRTCIGSSILEHSERILKSAAYKQARRLIDSPAYKAAQQTLKMRDALIHQDTLDRIQKLQDEVAKSTDFRLSETEKAALKQ